MWHGTEASLRYNGIAGAGRHIESNAVTLCGTEAAVLHRADGIECCRADGALRCVKPTAVR